MTLIGTTSEDRIGKNNLHPMRLFFYENAPSLYCSRHVQELRCRS